MYSRSINPDALRDCYMQVRLIKLLPSRSDTTSAIAEFVLTLYVLEYIVSIRYHEFLVYILLRVATSSDI